MIRLIIFDFDDTITDNSFLDYNAFVTPCKQLKIKIPQQNEFIKLRKKGLIAKEIMMKILKKQNKEDMLSEYLELRKKFLIKESIKYLILKKNTKSLLNYLKKSSMKLVICSANNNKKRTIKFIKKNNLRSKFSNILFMDDLNFHIDNQQKNNRILIKSSLLRHIIKTSSFKKKEILYIGNSDEDKTAAKKNKIQFIYFQNTYLTNIKNKNTVCSMSELQIKIKRF